MKWAFVFIVVGTVLLLTLNFTVFSADIEREHSVEWCENHNGTVSISNVIGSHGGFHCELPNGTVKHVYLAKQAGNSE